MKGRNRFTADEISRLKSYIRQKQSAPAGEQKRWRDKMRALGFCISDFQSGSEGFSDRDFDRLIERGAVEVVDQPIYWWTGEEGGGSEKGKRCRLGWWRRSRWSWQQLKSDKR